MRAAASRQLARTRSWPCKTRHRQAAPIIFHRRQAPCRPSATGRWDGWTGFGGERSPVLARPAARGAACSPALPAAPCAAPCSLFFRKEMELSLIGLQNAGKSSLVNVLTTGQFHEDMIPTVGCPRLLQRGVSGVGAPPFWCMGDDAAGKGAAGHATPPPPPRPCRWDSTCARSPRAPWSSKCGTWAASRGSAACGSATAGACRPSCTW
jgi:hypothetical protein